MITTGLTLALLTGCGFLFLYHKFPKRIRMFMQRHVLFTDTVVCLLTYILFGGTLVALFAAAWLGIIVSLILALVSNPTTAALINVFMKRVAELKAKFISWLEASSLTKTILGETDGNRNN